MKLALKVDVDTARGTKEGVTRLVGLFVQEAIPATFFFSLGPDNTGRAIRRIFRKGFLQKIKRTSVRQVYGFRTLGNGLLWPGPHIGKKYRTVLQEVAKQGFEVGIHCYDHSYWQDYLPRMSYEEIRLEFAKARATFEDIFDFAPQAAGAAGWQANALSLQVYDEAELLYGSDCRGQDPFYPQVNEQTFHTLQLPTTLPTLDELLGQPGYPLAHLAANYCHWMQKDKLNVLTIHAELEGGYFFPWFRDCLKKFKQAQISFTTLEQAARLYLNNPKDIPIFPLIQDRVPGRSGLMACQGIS